MCVRVAHLVHDALILQSRQPQLLGQLGQQVLQRLVARRELALAGNDLGKAGLREIRWLLVDAKRLESPTSTLHKRATLSKSGCPHSIFFE